MKKLLFADLDDTLFQSHRKAVPAANWSPAAYLKDGSTISYASPHQQALIEFFQRELVVIPVTARNRNAFERVAIKFNHEAILNYGGVVLAPDGRVDEFWLERSRTESHKVEASLDHCTELLSRECSTLNIDVRVRLISDYGIPFYIVAKSASGNVDSVRRLKSTFSRILPSIFTVHINHNNLAIIPHWLNKCEAVTYVRGLYESKYGEVFTFGMGDSLVDYAFMRSCDYMIVPSVSQLAEKFGPAVANDVPRKLPA